MSTTSTRKPRALSVRARKVTETSPGEPVVIDGVPVATIWSDGPRPSTVWALTSDGQAKVYATPTKKRPAFEDTGVGVPRPSQQWAALLNLAIAGQAVVVTDTRVPAAARGTGVEAGVVTHVPGCPDIPADCDEGFSRTSQRVGGVGLLRWLRAESVTSFMMDGFPAPNLTSVLDGQFCACTGAEIADAADAAA